MNDSFVMPYIKIKEWENKKISLLAMKNKLSKYSLNFWDGMSREFRFSILNSGIVLKQTNFAACRKHAAREIVYSIVYYITERLIELEAHISTEKKKKSSINIFKELFEMSLYFIPFNTDPITDIDMYDEMFFSAYSFLFRQFSVFNPYHIPIYRRKLVCPVDD